MKSKKLFYSMIFISIALLIIATLAYVVDYKGFQIYTYFWHVTNKTPVKWNEFDITVPKQLVGKHDNKDYSILYMADPDEVTIIFSEYKGLFEKTYDFTSLLNKIGFNLIERKEVMIEGLEAILLVAVSEQERPDNLEAIYFLTKPIKIVFFGKKKNRHYFDEIVSNLRLRSKKVTGGE